MPTVIMLLFLKCRVVVECFGLYLNCIKWNDSIHKDTPIIRTLSELALVYKHVPTFLIRIPSSLPMVTTKRGTIVVTHDYSG